MNLRHVALVYSTEQNADRFLINVLELKKSNPKKLSRELAQAIFNLDRELGMINYTNDSLQVEVFIDDTHLGKTRPVEHVCFEVDDLQAFLERCRREDVPVSRIPRGDYFLIFVRDADNNLFEIKEKKAVS
jgi:catechol 2,3-dioxygenase-like lactoylglutathione lyase family enzyme